MSDKDEGGVKNLKKMSDVIYEWPPAAADLKLLSKKIIILK